MGNKTRKIKLHNKFAVLILNYKRPDNLKKYIVPALTKERMVSKVIIAHGLRETVFDVDSLKDGEIIKKDKVWHIGNYKDNSLLRCFRRWELIYTLKKSGLLPEECIFVQDDDKIYKSHEIEKLYKAYKKNMGVLIGGSGRNIENDTYKINKVFGKCDIVIGLSIFGNVNDICRAVDEIHKYKVPHSITYEDDISICYFILKDKEIKNKQHYAIKLETDKIKTKMLVSNDALSLRPEHVQMRNKTLKYLLQLT
jgi:hypothetical protein